MSYIINNSRGQVLAVVADGTVNTTTTDLALVGRALTEYGLYENENYVYLLENFANNTAPLQPILGQLWFNSDTNEISTFTNGNAWAALASKEYVQLQLVSPAFTGTPTAPTAPVGTSNTQIATTAFVSVSPQFTGVPTAPTATPGTASTQLATTAFVTNSPQFAGVPTAPTAAQGTNTTQIATTAFVTSGPAFTGTPTAPTVGNATSSTQLATTEFVQNQKTSPAFSGVPTTTTPNYGDNSDKIASTAFVQNEKISPALSGVPTAPTAPTGTSNTQIATTQFVINELTSGDILGSMSQQDANAVNIVGGSISGINDLPVADGGTGASTAADARTNLGLGTVSTQNANSVSFTGGVMGDVALVGGSISNLATPLAVNSGGTGGNTQASARTGLGLGTVSTQNADNVNITGGAISGLSQPIAVADGGTGGGTAENARAGLGLGSMSVQDSAAVGITGGTITGITVLNASGVNITSGTITGITALAVADGGTGATDPGGALTNLGAASSSTQIIAGNGLTGGGPLNTNRTISIASNSNGFGTRYISTSSPSGGVSGDIWYQI